MVMVLVLCAGGNGAEVSGGEEGETGGARPMVISAITPEGFAQAYGDAASTGPEKFGFDGDGRLETTSERVALLESLHRQAERLGEGSVTALSKQALSDPTSTANERIVALRNVAQHSPEGRDELGDSLAAFLAEPQIAEEAPFAFLQALDGIVFLQDAAFVPMLSELAVDPASASSSRLALQRLATVNSLGVLRQLNAAPTLLRTLPGIRADLAASIDPSDSDSVAELERYLRRDDIDLAEKEKMILRMDQPAFVIADGIFTNGSAIPSVTDNWSEQVAKIQAAWGGREEFRELRAAINAAREARR